MTRLIITAAQILLLVSLSSAGDGEDSVTMNLKHLHKKEKLTHLRFYWHDTVKGQNPSAIMIQPAVSNSSLFGSITMMDDPLTINVLRNSTVVGQAQGIYAGAAQDEFGFLMMLNLAFNTGKYNGSTIAILGRNTVFSKIREMPVVGGTGIFRFARGYVEVRTNFLDLISGVAIVEYNCYVMHH